MHLPPCQKMSSKTVKQFDFSCLIHPLSMMVMVGGRNSANIQIDRRDNTILTHFSSASPPENSIKNWATSVVVAGHKIIKHRFNRLYRLSYDAERFTDCDLGRFMGRSFLFCSVWSNWCGWGKLRFQFITFSLIMKRDLTGYRGGPAQSTVFRSSGYPSCDFKLVWRMVKTIMGFPDNFSN